jgi:hypothetical protein
MSSRRRAIPLILALPQLLAQGLQSDVWTELKDVWNPFAEKMNKGVLDLKQWKKVVREVDKIEGRNCKTK